MPPSMPTFSQPHSSKEKKVCHSSLNFPRKAASNPPCSKPLPMDALCDRRRHQPRRNSLLLCSRRFHLLHKFDIISEPLTLPSTATKEVVWILPVSASQEHTNKRGDTRAGLLLASSWLRLTQEPQGRAYGTEGAGH